LADVNLFDFIGLAIDPNAKAEPESDSCNTIEPIAAKPGVVQYLDASDIL
jgi:hypothetical protein